MSRIILITGGAGFIGMNSSEQFIRDGWDVIVLDNLSRAGNDINLRYLEKNYAGKFKFVKADVRTDLKQLQECVNKSQVVLHLAAQVAVTTSVLNPCEDFQINAMGTFNVLEAVRNCPHKPLLMFSSTNKVYGKMEDVAIIKEGKRYRYKDLNNGISENRILDFYSPYGCSKGCADQYVRDYARIYDLPTVVFRQSCIYGPHQFGVEDQGWVAWFIIATVTGRPITIYGDGMQVRDVLHIDDLVDVYKKAASSSHKVKGKIYNVGGGPNLTMSLLELIDYLEKLLGRKIPLSFSDWRSGDQPIYVSDITNISHDLNWVPKISQDEGVKGLVEWVKDNKDILISILS